jgi:hypothetical protein
MLMQNELVKELFKINPTRKEIKISLVNGTHIFFYFLPIYKTIFFIYKKKTKKKKTINTKLECHLLLLSTTTRW